MSLASKLALQQAKVQATKTSIEELTKLRDKSKDENYRISANLVLAQLETKLRRQLAAVKLTEFSAQLGLKL